MSVLNSAVLLVSALDANAVSIKVKYANVDF